MLVNNLKNKKIIIVGIGGGGDILGCLPLADFLKRKQNKIIIAGLSWKRKVHDPQPGPRFIREFNFIKKVNDVVGLVNSKTKTKKGIKQIEADLAAIVTHPIATISINYGFRKTFVGFSDFITKAKIDYIIGIDVGGDVLLKGDEKTIRSPICDATMLGVLAKLKKSYLGVIGLGGDGELPLKTFNTRFRKIQKLNGFLECLNFQDSVYLKLETIISQAKTESSKPIVEMAREYKKVYRQKYVDVINKTQDISKITSKVKIIRQNFRNNTRVGELSCLTPVLFIFNPRIVYKLNIYSQYIEKFNSIKSIKTAMNKRGLITEIDEGN